MRVATPSRGPAEPAITRRVTTSRPRHRGYGALQVGLYAGRPTQLQTDDGGFSVTRSHPDVQIRRRRGQGIHRPEASLLPSITKKCVRNALRRTPVTLQRLGLDGHGAPQPAAVPDDRLALSMPTTACAASDLVTACIANPAASDGAKLLFIEMIHKLPGDGALWTMPDILAATGRQDHSARRLIGALIKAGMLDCTRRSVDGKVRRCYRPAKTLTATAVAR